MIILLFLLHSIASSSQQVDTSRSVLSRIRQAELARRALRSVTRGPEADTLFNYRSESAFLPYEGMVIRKIIIRTVHFNQSVLDTTRVLRHLLIRTGERLHRDTRENIIRNYLFLREGELLNPYRVADNERYLRDLEFIKDCRIYAINADADAGTVDLLVMPRDVFSFGAWIEPKDVDRFELKIQQANIAGYAQKVHYQAEYDRAATPKMAGEWLFLFRNLAGSFLDITVARSRINTGRSLGLENESATYLRLDRPLYMPYARWAGGLELSVNESVNPYPGADTLFADYRYRYTDLWAGFTFGHSQLPYQRLENRHRKFVAARLLDQRFSQLPQPYFVLRHPNVYANRQLAIGTLSFFRQDFYKTKFVYGFGRTEDIPYGYQVSITAGAEKLTSRNRPYYAIEFMKSITNKGGNIVTLNGSMEGYSYNRKWEDVLLKAEFSYFSKVYNLNRWSLRHFAGVNYLRYFQRTLGRPLEAGGSNGLQGFAADSLLGEASFRIRGQLLLFTGWKILGFNFALVPQYDLVRLADLAGTPYLHKTLQGFSLGIRTRNENLIFNTVELRGFYFPSPEGGESFRIELRSNLRIRYPTNLVRAPHTLLD